MRIFNVFFITLHFVENREQAVEEVMKWMITVVVEVDIQIQTRIQSREAIAIIEEISRSHAYPITKRKRTTEGGKK